MLPPQAPLFNALGIAAGVVALLKNLYEHYTERNRKAGVLWFLAFLGLFATVVSGIRLKRGPEYENF
jgi:hypothetical protein